MGILGSTLADSSIMGVRYFQRLTKDIPDSLFARQLVVDGKVIESSHPAFNAGHLCLYPAKVIQLVGANDPRATPSEEFNRLFSKEAKCVDDPSGTIYPSKSAIIDFFTQSHKAGLQALRNASDETLSLPNPIDTPARQFLPTIGALVGFYLGGHLMGHCGQISTWRRVQGLPPA